MSVSQHEHSMTEIAKCQQFSFQANNVKLIVISAVNIHGLKLHFNKQSNSKK